MKKGIGSRIRILVIAVVSAALFFTACAVPDLGDNQYDEIFPSARSVMSFDTSTIAPLTNPAAVVEAFEQAAGWTVLENTTQPIGRLVRARNAGSGGVFGLLEAGNEDAAQEVYDYWRANAHANVNVMRFGALTIAYGTYDGFEVFGQGIFTDADEERLGIRFYDNVDWNNFGDRDGWNLQGQWPDYGIGDPFIMRWNGMFYMYVSTCNVSNGIKAWRSENLIDWEQAGGRFCYETNTQLPLGFVVCPTDVISRRAYAPEIWYWDGTFYMYTSPAGAGHFIYTSDHPEGPFVRRSDNIGFSIDGNVFIDNDGWKYFTRASSSGIIIQRMSDMMTINSAAVTIANTTFGGWVEGSEVIYRRGLYFMTYTGRHVISDGYRVYYNWARPSDRSTTPMGGAFAGRQTGMWHSGFLNRRGMDLPTVLNTDDPEFRGVGHNTIVMGPDMDSHYMGYHNLNSSGGPNRSFNIDRMNFNGAQMTVSASPIRSIAPRMPVFWAHDTTNAAQFVTTADKIVSTESSGAIFSAEFNFRNTNQITVAFNYTNDQNFDAVDINLATNLMTLRRVTNGTSANIVANRAIIQRFGAEERLSVTAMHTVRIAQGADGLVDVYFNNLRRIGDQVMPGARAGGYIAYILTNASANAGLYYTAFSDVARGHSDRLEVDQYHGRAGAANFDPMLPNNLSLGVPLTEVAAGHHHGAMQLNMSAGDYVSYNVNFNRSGVHGIELTFPASAAGTTIRFTIEGGASITAQLPNLGGNHPPSMRAYIGSMPVMRGVHRVRVEAVGGVTQFISFRMFGSTLQPATFTHDLSTPMEQGADYRGIWRFEPAVAGEAYAHRARTGIRTLVFVGDRSLTNFVMDIDIRLIEHGVDQTAGVILRADNLAVSPYDTWQSIQGYFIGFSNAHMRFYRLNYDLSTNFGGNLTMAGAPSPANTWISRRFVVNGASIRLYNVTNRGQGNESTAFVWETNIAGVGFLGAGGMANMGGSAGFTQGRIGLYTNGAESFFRNLSIRPIT